MIHQNLLLILALFFAMVLLLSHRLKISYPILLVIGGLTISLFLQFPTSALILNRISHFPSSIAIVREQLLRSITATERAVAETVKWYLAL